MNGGMETLKLIYLAVGPGIALAVYIYYSDRQESANSGQSETNHYSSQSNLFRPINFLMFLLVGIWRRASFFLREV